jgi:hypothetical protein
MIKQLPILAIKTLCMRKPCSLERHVYDNFVHDGLSLSMS